MTCLLLLCVQLPAGAEPTPQRLHFVVEKFEILGNNPLSAEKTEDIFRFYLGDHYGLEGIQAAATAFEQALQKEGYAFYRLILPPQKLQQGVIRFELIELKLNRLRFEGNQHFSEDNLRRNLPGLSPGEAPDTRLLSRALGMANRQPSKTLKLSFAESETADLVDATLKVEELKPNFPFVSLNNTGNEETGAYRLTAGYQFSNLFDRDHNLSLSYTTSPSDLSAVKQYSASYTVPFYSVGGQLNVFLLRSDVDSGVVSNNISVSGAGTIALLHYKYTLLQSGAYKQELDFGFDHKLFDNKVGFLGAPATGTGKVMSRPLSLSYLGSWHGASKSISFNLAPFFNISGGANNDDAAYDDLRAKATADWSLLRYSLNYDQLFGPNWLVRLNIIGQYSSDRLIAGEQFGIGGIYSVRGFEERTLLGDSGAQGNLELWMPGFSRWQIRPIVFFDYGHVSVNIDKSLVGNETPSIDISSVGAGLRWSVINRFNAILDIAYVTGGAEEINVPGLPEDATRKGDIKAHFDLFYRF